MSRGDVWYEEEIRRRSVDEICDALQELQDRVWYDRHQMIMELVPRGDRELAQPIIEGEAAARRIEAEYGDELGPYDDFEWGMLMGKLSALRWVTGEEWDTLDT